jgi:hypothetical protein
MKYILSLILVTALFSCKKEDVNNAIVGLAVVNTIQGDSIGLNAYSITCEVVSEGDAVITERGFVWTTDENNLPPTVSGNKVICGAGVGNYTCNLDSVVPGLKYYVRAYAVNSKGVSYGQTISFSSNFAIGKIYQGGYILYLLRPGDLGYKSGENHGLIVCDTSLYYSWGCQGVLIQGANGTAIGTGKQNTIDIVNGCNELNAAAKICNDFVYDGFNDWFLPSIDETFKIIENIEFLKNTKFTSYPSYRLLSSSQDNSEVVFLANRYSISITKKSISKNDASFNVFPTRVF